MTVLLSHLRPGESASSIAEMESVHALLAAIEAAIGGRVPVQREPVLSDCSPVGMAMAAAHNQNSAGEWRTRFVLSGQERNM